MPKISNKKIIAKYLASESSNAEEQQLLKWLEKPDNQIIFKDHFKNNLIIDLKYKSFPSKKAVDLFLNQIKDTKNPKSNHKPVFRQWLQYAAIFIGILLASTYTIYWNDQNQSTPQFSILKTSGITLKIEGHEDVGIFPFNNGEIIKDKNGKELGVIKNDVLTYKNTFDNKNEIASTNIISVPYGKTFEVILADGTSVRLNSGSLLKYPSNFVGNDKREIYLEGEAYFDVAKDKKVPFIVKTKKLNTKVYGTTFNVSAYTNDDLTEVVLVEGVVGVKESKKKISDSDNYVMILPSQKASIRKILSGVKIQNVNVKSYVAWRFDNLVFDNENIASVFKKLERKFDIKIENNYSELYKHSYTGAFSSENVDEILTIMSEHTNFHYWKEGKKIIIVNYK